ncbi:MAG: acylphosphatase [Methylobacter sp.]|nr:acylphosphatase [Methylococcales bacterium]MDD5113274.1 acylphosphatase [Methylobacter sp.]
MTRKVNIVVSGRVQGVYFRAFTRRKAKQLDLVGRATNLADGRVEIIAQGDDEAIAQFITWCRKGPITARVDHIDINELPVAEELHSFEIK